MSGFTLHLFAAERHERIEAVMSFVGEDASGSFGILPQHDRFMTALTFGVARIVVPDRQHVRHGRHFALRMRRAASLRG